mmetsp:Transcript_62518/g.129870  ORF Transcript_62518/g.129870 Transcript_62518/m.129870 type:complete len:94 (+) Transcript_62518:966-1247(+)
MTRQIVLCDAPEITDWTAQFSSSSTVVQIVFESQQHHPSVRTLGPGTSKRIGSPSFVTVGIPSRTFWQVGIPVTGCGVRRMLFIRVGVIIVDL